MFPTSYFLFLNKLPHENYQTKTKLNARFSLEWLKTAEGIVHTRIDIMKASKMPKFTTREN